MKTKKETTPAEPCFAASLITFDPKAGQMRAERVDIFTVLSDIRNCRWAEMVENYRLEKAAGSDLVGQFRRNMPQLFVAGELTEARDDAIDLESDMTICDIDCHGEENAGVDMVFLRQVLTRLPWTVAVFSSCGGAGVKWVVRERVDGAPDRSATVRACERWLAAIGLPVAIDQRKNAMLRTTISSDPDCYINTRSRAFDADAMDYVAFDALLLIYREKLANIFSIGGGKYIEWLRDEHAFPERTESQAWRVFATAGFPKSQKERLCLHISQERHVSTVMTARSGFNEGVYDLPDGRTAIARSPKWIGSGDCTPDAFPTIAALLKSRFDDPGEPLQLEALFAWLKRARERVKSRLDYNDAGVDGALVCCPVLEVMGRQAVGKSQIYNTIILPLLGGREFDGKKVLVGGARFNAGAFGCEVLIIDDVSTGEVAKTGRGTFAQNIKSFLYSATTAIEGKFSDEVVLKNHAICAVQLFNEEALLSTPDWMLIKDKALFVCADVYYPFENEDKMPVDWAAVNARIARELPAFAGWLDHWTLPESLRPRNQEEVRNGFRNFCAAKCQSLLAGADYGVSLIDRFDAVLKPMSDVDKKKYYDVPLKVAEILRVLSFENARGLPSPESLGVILRGLSQRAEYGRIRCDLYGCGRVKGWVISYPPDETNNANYTPEYDDF